MARFVPQRIVCCAERARGEYAGRGYPESRMAVIPNGFDLTAFTPRRYQRETVRKSLQLSADDLVVGNVARYDPQKDHRSFLIAAEAVTRLLGQRVVFVLCGLGCEESNRELRNQIDEHAPTARVLLLGRRSDIPESVNSFDVSVSSAAFGEAFPNVIGEAMACAIPCVATDVGDSALILGGCGRIAPARDPEALADAIRETLTLSPEARADIGERARQRVVEHYEIGRGGKNVRPVIRRGGIAEQCAELLACWTEPFSLTT